ncbi:hypothetical protein C8C85_0549 [Flavobacterium sp. 103]|uniref:hypothetical protein n=1 Tax=unclassified Flavobacterium TaxID=196869 RepID=UPI000D5CF2F5|nr:MULTISPECIES: hypothetical protein [unclassified Flavobacterium]PVX44797.1 hypothetical protein C8C85_0549 [Flavobacterium sp. 103]QKJ63058.1 hypothetical protein HQN62_07900 [Flavobacterium sp. M31R6]
MKNHFVNQDKLNLFTKIISDKIQNGFVVVERNDKLPFTILYKEGKKINHGLNFLVCCMTFGMWSLPWLYLTQVTSKDKKVLIAIDEEGKIFEEKCYLG